MRAYIRRDPANIVFPNGVKLFGVPRKGDRVPIDGWVGNNKSFCEPSARSSPSVWNRCHELGGKIVCVTSHSSGSLLFLWSFDLGTRQHRLYCQISHSPLFLIICLLYYFPAYAQLCLRLDGRRTPKVPFDTYCYSD